MQGQSWLALNMLFAYAGCIQLVIWATRWGINGAMAGVMLLLMAWPLTPASYGMPALVFYAWREDIFPGRQRTPSSDYWWHIIIARDFGGAYVAASVFL